MRFWRRKQRRALILAFAVMAVAAPSAQAGRILVDGGAPVAKATPAVVSVSRNVQQGQLVRVSSGSFSWRDAGIGAATTVAASILVVTGISATRRRQGHVAV
jgi:hypothetical protein